MLFGAAASAGHGTTGRRSRRRVPRVAELRAGDGSDIVCFGSLRTWNDRLAHGLVDELHIVVGPGAIGSGVPTFTQPVEQELGCSTCDACRTHSWSPCGTPSAGHVATADPRSSHEAASKRCAEPTDTPRSPGLRESHIEFGKVGRDRVSYLHEAVRGEGEQAAISGPPVHNEGD